MNRSDIDNQINTWINDPNISQTKDNFKVLVSVWLDNQGVDDLTKKQVINDLESYQGFHDLER